MTPEAIRVISQLRGEFYTLFSGEMEVPVKITNEHSYVGKLSMASWVDTRKQLNYVCVYAYSAPDALFPDRPFILRISVNKGAGLLAIAKRGKDFQGLNQRWHFELTLMPEEILDFLPWIVSLVKSREDNTEADLLEPPHPLDCNGLGTPSLKDIWTRKAGQIAC
jgi:hypothetical protein